MKISPISRAKPKRSGAMKYKYTAIFENTPVCENCMLSHYDSASERRKCMALGMRPFCTEEGCRKDCPLVKDED